MTTLSLAALRQEMFVPLVFDAFRSLGLSKRFTRRTTVATYLFTFFVLIGLQASARGDVIIQFAEVSGDVVGTLTGALDLSPTPLAIDGNDFGTGFSRTGNSTSLLALQPGVADIYTGTSTPSSLTTNPSLWSESTSFGYIQFAAGSLYVDASTPLNASSYTPTGSYTWTSKTLSDIGLGALTETPVTVFTLAGTGGSTIQFALAPQVPEPSSAALMAIGLCLLVRRCRRS